LSITEKYRLKATLRRRPEVAIISRVSRKLPGIRAVNGSAGAPRLRLKNRAKSRESMDSEK
jgi:hypothetical protein